ncbi:hypothetical protein DFH27DRAFT_487492 [Peziza echinospora]|nr:hypothetical protein DFH27DRAFT_487492 [Peziza echinospora]
MTDTPQPRRYTIEELTFLADSPLVQKPDGLPAIEEWMGYELDVHGFDTPACDMC